MTTALAQTPFTPTGLEQASQLAMTLAKSTLIPEHLRGKPADVLVTIITGHELGLSPMQSLRGMHVINGKASMSADLMVALVLKHRDVCEFFRLVKSTDAEATYVTKRIGSAEVALTWTIAQAGNAGLAGKGTWKAHPAAMLRARCAAALARAVYPDLVLGVYDPDEAKEFSPAARQSSPTPPTDMTVDVEAVEVEAPAEEEPVVSEQDPATAKVLEAISMAETRGALLALVPEIKALRSEDIALVRTAYAQRQLELP